MIRWIKTCITTVHYTININGEMHGFFQATRGIRQGDPLSPYLFVLAMEGLTGIINQSVQGSAFKYHWRCKPTKLTHICFADDLMLFCHADPDSIMVLKSSLDKFSTLSGLTINLAKSSLYLSGLDGKPSQHNSITAWHTRKNSSCAISWCSSIIFTAHPHRLSSITPEDHSENQIVDILLPHLCW
jgi:hypothetical protein